MRYRPLQAVLVILCIHSVLAACQVHIALFLRMQPMRMSVIGSWCTKDMILSGGNHDWRAQADAHSREAAYIWQRHSAPWVHRYRVWCCH